MVKVMNVVGPHIRRARLVAKLTQAELAARLQLQGIKIDRAGVAKIEGKFRQVSDVELKAIVAVLGVSADWLLSETDTP